MLQVTPRRRGLLAITAGCLAVVAAATTALDDAVPAHVPPGAVASPDDAVVALYQDGVEILADGSVRPLPAGSGVTYLAGSRVVDPGGPGAVAGRPLADPGPDAGLRGAVLARAETSAAWLAGGRLPGAGTRFAALGESALLDLRALVLDGGAAVAGIEPHWRYVWPRDASFAAVALARTGHVGDAVEVLEFLASVQHDDGTFEARYLPDASGVPDDRAAQADGAGWALWAVDEVVAATARDDGPASAPSAAEVRARLSGLTTRSTDAVLALVATPDGLPPASPDYWEVSAPELTLGTAAPLLAGLEASSRTHAAWHDDAGAERAAAGAARLRTGIETTFGSAGYPREISGGPSDAATAFALPPFQPTPLRGADDAWRASVTDMLRPAGGLAPGGSWRRDGISWTPQTALYALTAASTGDRDQALHWLGWIDEHRTASGAIPEKVLADGSPAAVAPLAWTSALVVIALDELDR
ncbi:GH15 family glucan-1,4-alpha-glucosidase [Sediminihabitans luteus]|uniref:GH15 family glucan-1,4-alpha-glucosidase n=1 Tax=Sediminihabitans luteus TaxID=1138585 RepID=A0A2M9CEA1_9CELL|nr:glycoside hydrolase family 15 [Sediminihabitans luteus]PJJ70192.1 GH15 family glucan-1,4-alpha-glucosidase [Sediminihabitans luteus]GII97663.1 hypothetical protein Slu03_00410 [Sediminihabitans luteus]